MHRRTMMTRLSSIAILAAFFPSDLPAQPIEDESNTKLWTTRDGRQIRIVDLTDDHLRNIIFFLQRRYATYWSGPSIIPELPVEAMWPIYTDLVREADRRKLSWGPRA